MRRIDNLAVLAFIISVFASGSTLANHGSPHGGGGGGKDKASLESLGCTDEGDIAKIVGGVWACADDIDTTDTNWGSLTGVPAGLNDGDDDTLGGLGCDPEQIAMYNGAIWECADGPQAGIQLLDGTDQPIGIVTDADTRDAKIKVLVNFPGYPRAISLVSKNEFGDTFFEKAQEVVFTQENCIGTGYGLVGDVLRYRTADMEPAFVGMDNAGNNRLYVAPENPVVENNVIFLSFMGEETCRQMTNPIAITNTGPLILLDPDLLTTFPLPHSLIW